MRVPIRRNTTLNTSLLSKKGFTIIELLVVIVVISILASLVFVNYTGYVKKATESQLKTDLLAAATEMRKQQSQTGNLPTNISDTPFSPSKGIQITGGSSNGTTFCLLGVTSKYGDLKFTMTDANPQPQSGNYCPPTGPPVITGGSSSYYLTEQQSEISDTFSLNNAGIEQFNWTYTLSGSHDVEVIRNDWGYGSSIDLTMRALSFGTPGCNWTLHLVAEGRDSGRIGQKDITICIGS